MNKLTHVGLSLVGKLSTDNNKPSAKITVYRGFTIEQLRSLGTAYVDEAGKSTFPSVGGGYVKGYISKIHLPDGEDKWLTGASIESVKHQIDSHSGATVPTPIS